MHALLPRGHDDFDGADAIVDTFTLWFGSATEFEVLATTSETVGDRGHASWRLRLHPTPKGDDRWHVIEQQVYTRGEGPLTEIDLLCTGFSPEAD